MQSQAHSWQRGSAACHSRASCAAACARLDDAPCSWQLLNMAQFLLDACGAAAQRLDDAPQDDVCGDSGGRNLSEASVMMPVVEPSLGAVACVLRDKAS